MRKEREVLFVYAVIETGGKQYKVAEGDVIFVEKLDKEQDTSFSLDKVLAFESEGNFKTGTPYIDGASVEAKVIKQVKSKKIYVFKYKAKKNEKKKIGHRQRYTKIEITKINA